ncbi:hypothetical protein C2S51_013675 [Perilla frutescens var. frutescens]|nr:hypothetical protein C2S51_013675 [Perilla frutescens var. frutescens]
MKLEAFSIAWFYFCINVCFSNGRPVSGNDIGINNIPPVRAVNLGGWLVTEGWMRPSLFDAIPNNDFLDGTRMQFKSVALGTFLHAENGGGTNVVANGTAETDWETFRLWRINETTFNLRVSSGKFVGLRNGIDVVAVADAPAVTETFEFHRNPHDFNRLRIKASNGFFLQVKSKELVSADYEGDGGWGDENPSVFLITNGGKLRNEYQMRGEYQITNGYGPLLAPKVMKEHWNTFVVENDFKFIKKIGLNAVRVPVGWWIAYDPNPPKPFVGGSLLALDKAFSWAEKYGIKVIINLHAAPGSQNGWEHSASRDGSQEWGKTNHTIQQTIHVIEFLTARYAKSPSLYAVELINEPRSPGVSLDTLSKFYRAGYDVVRKHSQTAYVVWSNRLAGPHQPRELFDLAKGLNKIVIDVHMYNLFTSFFDGLTVQEHIDYVYNNRSAELKEITTPDGPLVFIGEWVAELPAGINATKDDRIRFGEAQLQVFGRATFGWAIWGLRNVEKNKYWNLEWMINNGYIKF